MLRHHFLALQRVSPSPLLQLTSNSTKTAIVRFAHQKKDQSKFTATHQQDISNPPPQTHKMADMADEMADRLEGSSTGGRGRGGQRARGGRGGGGGAKGRGVDLSRALSKLLRHQAGNAGIQLDSEGYAPLELVLQWGPIRALSPTFSEILTAVRESDKQRFAIKPNPKTNPSLDESSTDPSHWLIRANQGHSIKVESENLHKPISIGSTLPEDAVPVPPTVIHGTYFAFWSPILQAGGLKPMGRNHVHCSVGLPEDEAGVISGMRKDAELMVYIDVEGSIREGGMKWWMSENGVVLTEGDENGVVPVRFFKEVVGRRQNVGVLWKDGEKVADLPDGIKVKAPAGKGAARGSRGGNRGRGSRGKRQGKDTEEGEEEGDGDLKE